MVVHSSNNQLSKSSSEQVRMRRPNVEGNEHKLFKTIFGSCGILGCRMC